MEKTSRQRAASANGSRKRKASSTQARRKRPERRGRARVRVRGRKIISPKRSPRRSSPNKPRKAKGLKPIMVYYCLNKKTHQNVPARCQRSPDGPSTSSVAQTALSSAPRQGALGSSKKVPVVPAEGNGQ